MISSKNIHDLFALQKDWKKIAFTKVLIVGIFGWWDYDCIPFFFIVVCSVWKAAKRVNPKSSHHKEKLKKNFLSIVYVWNDGWSLNLLWSFHDVCKSSHHAVYLKIIQCCMLIPFSRSVMSYSLWPHGLQHARLPFPSPFPGACSNSCPSSQWCHPTISSSVIPFSSCLQSFPAWGSFPMSQFFASGGQSIGASASASVLPMNDYLNTSQEISCS